MTTTAEAVSAVTGHHAQLQLALAARVEAVVAVARDGRPEAAAVLELRTMLAGEVVPHARAEEDVLYAAAAAPDLRLLVAGMVFEHQMLLGLADELAAVTTAVDAAVAARSIRDVFTGHVRRENELLLPALAADPRVDLTALLPVMAERFAAYRSAT